MSVHGTASAAIFLCQTIFGVAVLHRLPDVRNRAQSYDVNFERCCTRSVEHWHHYLLPHSGYMVWHHNIAQSSLLLSPQTCGYWKVSLARNVSATVEQETSTKYMVMLYIGVQFQVRCLQCWFALPGHMENVACASRHVLQLLAVDFAELTPSTHVLCCATLS